MLKSVQFKNFKALEDTELPLGRFTLIVGPNGSGKSTALTGILSAWRRNEEFSQVATVGLPVSSDTEVFVRLHWEQPYEGVFWKTTWRPGGRGSFEHKLSRSLPTGTKEYVPFVTDQLERARIFSLQANAISARVGLQPEMELSPEGGGLAGVLDRLRDHEPERFEELNRELGEWIPEFDRILFDVPSKNARSFSLRTCGARHEIPASDLSDGTLFALVLLTLSYLPDPPSIVCLEDPDQGIHPRLLRRVQDAIYRLAYPENFGDNRDPVQVIATTHSPYFLDLFKDHPEEVVISEKTPHGVRFQRLSELPNVSEILADAPLGEVWYTGILGGVPTGS
jgi:predicted ATPase